ncbi:PLC-like phosphodiesterase [Zopfochytrium polystomum]|nr:PLC-like phosphodiesterase [Zopfochytrium polystomum]
MFNVKCEQINATSNSCGSFAAFATCGYENQGSDLATLLNMGVRWLDIAFVGYNPTDTTQPYSAHNSLTSTLGIAYGPSASDVFSTIGSFLAANPREVVFLYLKASERDDAIKSASGANGYTAFFDRLRSSPAGAFLFPAPAQTPTTWPTLGALIAANTRLIVLGWPEIPSDVGIASSDWYKDSWSNPASVADLRSEAATACASGLPVILQEILPFDGVCVKARAANEVAPALIDIVSGCATPWIVLVDYLSAGDAVFSWVQSKNQAATA